MQLMLRAFTISIGAGKALNKIETVIGDHDKK